MKVKKIIKTVITVLAVFIAVIIIKNPDKALATQTGEDDVYAELTDVQLDDSHSINIYAHTHVSYAYDEGAYGWVINIIPQSWSKTSDNVTIDNMDYEDDYGYQTSTATYVFHYTAHAAFGEGNYDGYATFKFYVDEWGDFDYWLE